MQPDRPILFFAGRLARSSRRVAARLRGIVDDGDRPLALLIMAGTVFTCLVPIVALVISLAFSAAHFE